MHKIHPIVRPPPAVQLMLAVVLAGCGDRSEETGTVDCAGAPTWDNFAQGYVTTWCLPCHSESIPAEARQGAPEEINFDNWSQVFVLQNLVYGRVNDPVAPMPPLGGVPERDQDLFNQWIECGALGEDEPEEPCATLTEAPATTITSQADADGFCESYNAAASVTLSGTAELTCLCAITGDLEISGGEADLPALTEVGGSVRITAGTVAVRMDELLSVGADFLVQSVPGLVDLSVSGLDTVGGDVTLQDLDAIELISLDHLYSVGGSLQVSDTASATTLDVARLRSTGGDLVVEDAPELVALLGTRALDSVGGSLVLQNLPSLPVLDDFAFMLMYDLGQDLIIADNASLLAIHGLPLLGSVPGTLAIEDNASLVRVDGLDNVTFVGGDLRLRNNPSQQHLLGLYNLVDVDGAVVLEDLDIANLFSGFDELQTAGELRIAAVGELLLSDFPVLAAVDGDLTITANPKMTGISGLGDLVTVGGDLTLTNNLVLAGISGFGALKTVDGSVLVSGNPALPAASAQSWVDGLVVGGGVTVTDNGP
jgi:hypothetical protein